MLKMRNDFVVTNSDCMQCRKYLEDRKFLFVQAIEMDGDSKYCVGTSVVDLRQLSFDDIENAICGRYGSIKSMEKSYGLPLGQLDEVVATCFFDNNPTWDLKSEITKEERVEKIIQKFIDTNGMVLWNR